MVKRKCGNCRYFRDAEIACSGWCTHPERGDLHDLVLVRRAELACRNSWDQDLWQPRPQPAAVQHASMREREIPRVPEPVGGVGGGVVPENPTDRVTSISISQVQGRRTREQLAAPPAVTGGQPSEAASLQERPSVERDERETTRGPSEAGVSSIEPSFKRVLRTSGGRPTSGTPRLGLESIIPDGAARSHVKRQDLTHPEELREGPRPALERQVSTLRPELESDTSPLPVEEVNRLFSAVHEMPPAQQVPRQPVVPPPAPADPMPHGNRERGAGGAHIHVDVAGDPRWVRLGEPEKFATREGQPKPLGPWPIDERTWARGIPRCCETCREFQSNSDGKTGVCGSKYAFTRRTVVECDQLACRSSVGVWWLPSDDFWLDRAEIAHHTRPTPYLDAILSELQAETR